MFCAQCGTQLATDTTACIKCGSEPTNLSTASSLPLGHHLQRQFTASSKDAASALRLLATNPVGDLPTAYAELGPARARNAGIALCVVFSLAAAIGIRIAAEHWLSGLLRFTSLTGVGAFLKLFLLLLVPPAALASASYLVRRILASSSDVSPDIFTAGAALVPTGLALLLAGLLGIGNLEIVILLFLFASCYLTLMLYSGLTIIGNLPPKAAAPAVPVITILTAWITKIVFAALF